MRGCRSRATPCLPHSAGTNESLIWMKEWNCLRVGFSGIWSFWLKLQPWAENRRVKLQVSQLQLREIFFIIRQKNINGTFFYNFYIHFSNDTKLDSSSSVAHIGTSRATVYSILIFSSHFFCIKPALSCHRAGSFAIIIMKWVALEAPKRQRRWQR